jgi:hypothetical protein
MPSHRPFRLRRPVRSRLLAGTALLITALTMGTPSRAGAAPSEPLYAPSSTSSTSYSSSSTSRPANSSSSSTFSSSSLPASTSVVPQSVTPPSTTAPSSAPPPSDTASTAAPAPPSVATFPAGGSTDFPGSLVGPVPAADVPIERAMSDVYVKPSGDPNRPDVVVQFRAPFPLPSHAYRVSIVVGDPQGTRLRVSMIDNGVDGVTWQEERSTALPPTGPPPAGTAATVAAPSWEDVATGPTGASFSPTGSATISVPLADAPDGPDVWAEVETGTDGSQVSMSPLFAKAALFAPTPPDAPLPSGSSGLLAELDGTSSGQYVTLPDGPTLAIANHAIKVATTERPPSQLAGQPVTKVIDVLRIAPDYQKRGVVTDYVAIDRTTGDVRLIDGMSLPPTDQTGDSSWLLTGLDPADPGAPTTMQIDLAGVVRALHIDVSGTATAIGLRRQYVLADGTQIAAEGVLGTLGWFDPTAAVGLDQPTPVDDGAPLGPVAGAPSSSSSVWLYTLGAVFVGVALLALAIAAVTERRRRDAARRDAADELIAIAVETEEHRAITREERRLATQEVEEVEAVEAVEAVEVDLSTLPPPPVPVRVPVTPAPPSGEVDLSTLPPPPTREVDLSTSTSAPAEVDLSTLPPPPINRRVDETHEEHEVDDLDDLDDEDDPLESPLYALIDLTDPGRSGRRRDDVEPDDPRQDPDDALATLDAEFADLGARLRRLAVSVGSPPSGRS